MGHLFLALLLPPLARQKSGLLWCHQLVTASPPTAGLWAWGLRGALACPASLSLQPLQLCQQPFHSNTFNGHLGGKLTLQCPYQKQGLVSLLIDIIENSKVNLNFKAASLNVGIIKIEVLIQYNKTTHDGLDRLKKNVPPETGVCMNTESRCPTGSK